MESIARDICGSESGYRKHRRMKESKCQPCKDAHNVHRRDTYNPDKNREHKKNYLSKPEKKELLRQTHKKYNLSTEEKERRRLERLAITNEKNKIRSIEKELKIKEKERVKKRLNNQHGTSTGDYERCRKNRAVACGLCLAAAAKYSREQVAKNPDKYRERKRRSRQKNGHVTSRDRAKKNGGQYAYYTRKQIFDRDGYDCYLCQEPVDLTAPHVLGQLGWETYPHVEHVVPLALGGDDTLENVKIAHAKCNIDKGVLLLPSTL